jgi:hypothetical protein
MRLKLVVNYTDKGLMKFLLLWALMVGVVQAQTPTLTAPPSQTNLLDFQKQPGGSDAPTYRMLNDQERTRESGTRSVFNYQDSIISGNQRAKDMVELLKKQQLQSAFEPLNARGKQVLQENPDLKSPTAIIAGMAALWVGRTVKLIRGDSVKLNGRIEARARSGEFSLESPIFNGRLVYTGGDGIYMNVNRSIAELNSRAEMIYSQKDQTISGALVHPLLPHLDLSFGASQFQSTNQTDGRASLQFNLNF